MRPSGELVISSLMMKTKKLFSKLFPTYFFISLAGLFILLIITRFAFRNFYFEETLGAVYALSVGVGYSMEIGGGK